MPFALDRGRRALAAVATATAVLLASLGALGGCARGGAGAEARDGGRQAEDAGRAGETDAAEGGNADAATTPTDAGHADAGHSLMPDAGRPDAGRPDAGHRDAGPPTCPPAAGDIVIVEVMIASAAGADRGEWFEIESRADCFVSLAGVDIVSPTSSGDEKVHTIGHAVVPPRARFVLALSSAPIDNHGLVHDYAYGSGGSSDVILNNGTDWLELRSLAFVLDRVAWPSGGYTIGRSRELDGTADAARNDDWSSWCDATSVYSTLGGTFYGTPGASNGSCP
jgi:hypothetical protein